MDFEYFGCRNVSPSSFSEENVLEFRKGGFCGSGGEIVHI
jgi:hypothetical protein